MVDALLAVVNKDVEAESLSAATATREKERMAVEAPTLGRHSNELAELRGCPDIEAVEGKSTRSRQRLMSSSALTLLGRAHAGE